MVVDVSRFRDAAILVVGDVMLDNFVYGEAKRISPEAPVPVLAVHARKSMPGGAANVAVNVAALGAQATLIGVVGDDAEGRMLAGTLPADRKSIKALLIKDAGRPTTVKTRYIARSQQVMRADSESTAFVSGTVEHDIIDAVSSHIGRHQVLILSDYGKGALSDSVIAATISIAAAAGVPVLVDPKRRQFDVYHGASYIKPNVSELTQASGIEATSDDTAEEAAGIVCRQTGGAVLLTRSEQGMALFRDGMRPFFVRSVAREVFDVSGAGDTALAAFATTLAIGESPEDATRVANTAASIAVGKLGTASVGSHELDEALADAPHLAAKDHVATRELAARMCQKWRARGLKVGFTNGCFDILHAGHVSLLAQAATMCDRLVVAINTDASVKRLKGPGRPAQGEATRLQVMSALSAVDLVVPFDEDTPLELIELLKPDVLIKGADYREDEVVGADLVKSLGGEIVLIDIVPGVSTTKTISRITAGPGAA